MLTTVDFVNECKLQEKTQTFREDPDPELHEREGAARTTVGFVNECNLHEKSQTFREDPDLGEDPDSELYEKQGAARKQ